MKLSSLKSGPVLVINICHEKLHYSEFVLPICNILLKHKITYKVLDYSKISKSDLKQSSRVIICGTSLKDNFFYQNLSKFKWITKFDKPILGICGGMQIIGLLYNGDIKKETEIGFYKEKFVKEFLGLFGEKEVYHLHNNYVDFSKLNEFEVFCGNEFSQAVMHKEKKIYGVLFHPEVRQKDLILNFCSVL